MTGKRTTATTTPKKPTDGSRSRTKAAPQNKLLSPAERRIVSRWLSGLADEDIDPELAGSVAQIVFRGAPRHLPLYSDDVPRKRQVARKTGTLDNQLLFTISWATSGPGVDWPESYALTHVPEFDGSVVTVSWDSTESAEGSFGIEATELAVAWIPDGENVQPALRSIICRHWERQRDIRGRGSRFESILANGLLPSKTVLAWADQVWPDSEAADS